LVAEKLTRPKWRRGSSGSWEGQRGSERGERGGEGVYTQTPNLSKERVNQLANRQGNKRKGRKEERPGEWGGGESRWREWGVYLDKFSREDPHNSRRWRGIGEKGAAWEGQLVLSGLPLKRGGVRNWLSP